MILNADLKAHISSCFCDDDDYTGCAHCCDERFSTMLTGGFQYAYSNGLPLDSTRVEDLTDFSTTYPPILEGLLDEGGYQLPPRYANDLGGMIEDMGDFAKAFYNYLGGEGLGSCVQEYASKFPATDDLPSDDVLMTYCN